MTVSGLPLHPLILHATVVLLPIMALLTIVVAVRSSLRDKGIWWVVAGNAVMTGVTFLTKQSGESLQKSLGGQIAKEHGQLGSVLPVFAFVLFLASAAIGLTRRNRTLGLVASVVSVLAAVATTVWTIRTGDSGARVVYQR